jgi:hypothetical protein
VNGFAGIDKRLDAVLPVFRRNHRNKANATVEGAQHFGFGDVSLPRDPRESWR